MAIKIFNCIFYLWVIFPKIFKVNITFQISWLFTYPDDLVWEQKCLNKWVSIVHHISEKKFCNSSRSAMSLSRSKYVINPLFVFITAGLNNPCSYKDSPWFPLKLLYFPHHIYVRFNPFTVSDCSQNCNIVRYLFIN